MLPGISDGRQTSEKRLGIYAFGLEMWLVFETWLK